MKVLAQPRLGRVLSFLLILMLTLTSCDRSKAIVNDLDEREANEIVVYLARRGINSQKVVQEAKGGGGGQGGPLYKVTVHSSEWIRATELLNLAGLPRRRSTGLLDIFGQGGLVSTQREEQIKYIAGLEQQIAATLRKIDGVLEADVALSVPEENPLNPEAVVKDKTASVYIKHQGVLDDPNSHLKTKIKQLVASSVDGLKFENVTVIPDRARFGADPDTELGASWGQGSQEFQVIWSIVVSRDTAPRFQLIFVSFILAITILGLLVVWILWKVFPVLIAAGGFGQLFHFKPISLKALLDKHAPKPKKKPRDDDEDDEDSTLANIEDEDFDE